MNNFIMPLWIDNFKMLPFLEKQTIANRKELSYRIMLLFNTFARLDSEIFRTLLQLPDKDLDSYVYNLKKYTLLIPICYHCYFGIRQKN